MKAQVVIVDSNFDQVAGSGGTDDDISVEIMDRHEIAQSMVDALLCEAVLSCTLQEPHDGNFICHTIRPSTFVTNVQVVTAHNHGRAKLWMSVPADMMEPASLRHLLPERPCVLAGEGGLGKEVKAASKPQGRRVHVRKGKVTTPKVSEVLNSVARLVRAVGVLVDALSKWIG